MGPYLYLSADSPVSPSTRVAPMPSNDPQALLDTLLDWHRSLVEGSGKVAGYTQEWSPMCLNRGLTHGDQAARRGEGEKTKP